MIIDGLLIILYYLIIGIIAIFPVADTTNIVHMRLAVQYFAGFLDKIDLFFPVDTWFAIVKIWLLIGTAYLLYQAYNFVINKVRGSG